MTKPAFTFDTLVRMILEFVIAQLLNKESFFNRVLLDRLRDLFDREDDPAPSEAGN